MENPAGNGKIEGMPAEHHKLGKLLFCWVTPSSTKALNLVLILLLVLTILATAYLVLTGSTKGSTLAAPWTVFILYSAIWACARTPSGTPCAVYTEGITDNSKTIFFSTCKVALEATRHLTRVASPEGAVETGSSYEVRVFDGELDFTIKGWGEEYRHYYLWFRDYLVPRHLERDRKKLEAGESLTVGQFKINKESVSHPEEGTASWQECSDFQLKEGEIIIKNMHIPLFVGGAHVLLELLAEKKAD